MIYVKKIGDSWTFCNENGNRVHAMNKLIISIIIILITQIACGVNIPSHINTAPAAKSAPVPSLAMTVCNSYGLNVRKCPDVDCNVVDWKQDGDTVIVKVRWDTWALTADGWVHNNYLCEVK